jgi:hypothetical protein
MKINRLARHLDQQPVQSCEINPTVFASWGNDKHDEEGLSWSPSHVSCDRFVLEKTLEPPSKTKSTKTSQHVSLRTVYNPHIFHVLIICSPKPMPWQVSPAASSSLFGRVFATGLQEMLIAKLWAFWPNTAALRCHGLDGKHSHSWGMGIITGIHIPIFYIFFRISMGIDDHNLPILPFVSGFQWGLMTITHTIVWPSRRCCWSADDWRFATGFVVLDELGTPECAQRCTEELQESLNKSSVYIYSKGGVWVILLRGFLVVIPLQKKPW